MGYLQDEAVLGQNKIGKIWKPFLKINRWKARPIFFAEAMSASASDFSEAIFHERIGPEID